MPLPQTTISGTAYDAQGNPLAGVELRLHMAVQSGVLIQKRSITIAISNSIGVFERSEGVPDFLLLRNSTSWLSGGFYIGGKKFDVTGDGVPMAIPDSPTATLESLGAAAVVPVQGLTVVGLPNLIGTFNFSSAFAKTESPTGQANIDLAASLIVTTEQVQDALTTFFPDAAPYDWTYDDAGNAVGLVIAPATGAVNGLMSAADKTLFDVIPAALSAKANLISPTFTTPVLGVASATSLAVNAGQFVRSDTFADVGARKFLETGGAAYMRLGEGFSTIQIQAADLVILREAANTLAQRNGVNAQAFRLYNTYTDVSNYERASINFTSNQFRVGTESAGTGGQRSLILGGNGIEFKPLGANFGSTSWQMNNSGHLMSSAAAGLNIGSLVAPIGKLSIPLAPTGSANFGLCNLGSGPFDGASAGFFVGHASGTVLAVNAASGFAGDLLNLQVAGVLVAKISAAGVFTLKDITDGVVFTISKSSGAQIFGVDTNTNITILHSANLLQWNSDTTISRQGNGVLRIGTNAANALGYLQAAGVTTNNASSTGIDLNYNAGGQLRLGSAALQAWTSTINTGTVDTTLSRNAAGIVQVGTIAANALGKLNCAEYQVAGVKLLGAQGAAVADATGAGDVVAQLNALLARLRAATGHGLIA